MSKKVTWAAVLTLLALTPPGIRAQASDTGTYPYEPIVLKQSGFVSVIVGSSRFMPAYMRRKPDLAGLRCSPRSGSQRQLSDIILADSTWAGADSVAAVRPYILLQFTPFSTSADECALAGTMVPGVVARGVDLSSARAFDKVTPIDSIRITIGDHAVPAAIERRARVSFPLDAGSSDSSSRPMQWRIYVPASLLAPDIRGHMPVLRATAYYRQGAADHFEVPASVVWELWRQNLSRTMAAAPPQVAGSTPSRILMLPQPADPQLGSARIRYLSGDYVTAVDLALSRVAWTDAPRKAPFVQPTDARDADMLLGAALLAVGDSAAAVHFFTDALASAPCLTLPADASFEYQALIEGLRPPARCQHLSLGGSIATLAFPGLGSVLTQHRSRGLVAMLATAALAAQALKQNGDANSAYATYQASQSGVDVIRLYSVAQDQRASARRTASLAATLWAIEGLWSVLDEHHARGATARVANYGGCMVERNQPAQGRGCR